LEPVPFPLLIKEAGGKYSMRVFWKVVDWIQDWLKILGAGCLVGMMFLTCIDVIGRLMGHPIFGAVEIVGFMATMAVATALPYTHKAKGHIGVEMLWQALSEKTRAIVDLCTGFLSLGLFIIITWRMTLYARTMQDSGEVSMNLELPEHFIVYAVAFCFIVFTLIIVEQILKTIKYLSE
jgi:TRAP-type C4-dicarboxylate transport system permease small subunit